MCGACIYWPWWTLFWSIFAKIFRWEGESSSSLVNDQTVFFWLVVLAPHFPHSHFSYSLVSSLFSCLAVPLFLCSSVLSFLRFSVPLFSCPPLFLFFHFPSSLPFHVFCFPPPAFRCLFPQLFLSSFSLFFSATLFFPSIPFLRVSNFDSPSQKRWETNANQQT